MSKIIVLSPHPDDEVIWAGGTILKLSEYRDILVVYVTDGRRSPTKKYSEKEMSLLGKKRQKSLVINGD